MNFAQVERSNLYYWRDRGNEVDFIIELGGKIVGIEVKSGRRVTNKCMAIFAEKFNPNRAIVIGTGGTPLEEFLQRSPIDLFQH